MEQLPEFAEAPLRPFVAVVGGSPVPQALVETWGRRGVALTTVYGITEAGACVTAMPPGRELDHNGTVGLPLLYARCRVRTTDGRPAAPGETGELQLSGPLVTPGYWRNPTATAEAFTDDGWLHTGDAATDDRRRPRRAGRPVEGHVHLRRGERLPGRGGERAACASGRQPGRRRRGAAPAVGRGRGRLRRPGPRRRGRPRRPPGLVPRAARRVQGPGARARRRRAAAQRHRQGAQGPAARVGPERGRGPPTEPIPTRRRSLHARPHARPPPTSARIAERIGYRIDRGLRWRSTRPWSRRCSTAYDAVDSVEEHAGPRDP